ncbi:hypothetical protein NQZ68_018567 [Dissostichus eleginoides]|nr:hypothetical protein NQZ68_018567 [Dissostichus eleginoides]
MSLWFSLAGSLRRMAWGQIEGPDGRSSCRGRDEGRPDMLGPPRRNQGRTGKMGFCSTDEALTEPEDQTES